MKTLQTWKALVSMSTERKKIVFTFVFTLSCMPLFEIRQGSQIFANQEIKRTPRLIYSANLEMPRATNISKKSKSNVFAASSRNIDLDDVTQANFWVIVFACINNKCQKKIRANSQTNTLKNLPRISLNGALHLRYFIYDSFQRENQPTSSRRRCIRLACHPMFRLGSDQFSAGGEFIEIFRTPSDSNRFFVCVRRVQLFFSF